MVLIERVVWWVWFQRTNAGTASVMMRDRQSNWCTCRLAFAIGALLEKLILLQQEVATYGILEICCDRTCFVVDKKAIIVRLSCVFGRSDFKEGANQNSISKFGVLSLLKNLMSTGTLVLVLRKVCHFPREDD
jgi:hypothetical protein